MTKDNDKKDDPFAPLPLPESLSGTTRAAIESADPFAPQPLPASLSEPTRTAAPEPLASQGDPEPPLAEPVSSSESTRATTSAESPHATRSAAPPPEPTPDSLAAEPDPLTVENDLRAAIGATPLVDKKKRASTEYADDDDDDDDGTARPRSRKAMFVGALALFVGAGITALVLLGRVNSARYVLACEAERVVVKQGRSFPPWGESTLDGAEWKPLAIPPEAPCSAQETESKAELAGWFGKMIEDRATALLTAREVQKVDEAEANLKQALIVARSLASEDARIDTRERIERLLGDVSYWRASAKLAAATDALAEAAKQFDAAALQKPRYVTDAAAWATYVRQLVEDLKVGPAGVKAAAFPPVPSGPSVPPGIELPVEPDAGSGSAAEPTPPPQPDAGAPSGGVLL